MSSDGNNSHDLVGQVSQNTYIQRMHWLTYQEYNYTSLHTKTILAKWAASSAYTPPEAPTK